MVRGLIEDQRRDENNDAEHHRGVVLPTLPSTHDRFTSTGSASKTCSPTPGACLGLAGMLETFALMTSTGARECVARYAAVEPRSRLCVELWRLLPTTSKSAPVSSTTLTISSPGLPPRTTNSHATPVLPKRRMTDCLTSESCSSRVSSIEGCTIPLPSRAVAGT